MISKPPPITPPPIKQRQEQPAESNRTFWIIAAAVFLGALLATIVLPWLAMRSNFGDEGDRSKNGGSGSMSASLEASNASSTSSAEAKGAAPDQAEKTTERGETRNINVDSAHPNVNANTEESKGGDDTDAIGGNEEAKLLIVKEKRALGVPTRSGSRSQSLDHLGGANPFVGSGPPARSTVYVIDVSGSMQTPDRLPRVVSTLNADFRRRKSTHTFVEFDFWSAVRKFDSIAVQPGDARAVFVQYCLAQNGVVTSTIKCD